MSAVRRALPRRALPVVAALTLAVAGCSTSTGSDDTSDISVVAESASESTTTTTAAPTTAAETTAPAPAPTGTGSPRDSATRLYDAWHADDPVTAATVADQNAIDGMWQTARGDYSLYNDCDSAEFETSGCLFRGANGTIQFTMERRGDSWVVVEAFYSAP